MCFFVTFIGCGRSVSKQSDSGSQEETKQTVQEGDVPKGSGDGHSLESSKKESEGSSFQPFYVYSNKGARQNHYIPSGFMPNGKCVKFTDKWKDDCYEGHTCMKVEYDVECSREDEKWAGIYWLNPANNWGSRKGGFNLTGAKKLTFWAKGEKGGEQIQEFTIGGINGDYPDTDTAVIGPVILGAKWREYTIDLRGKDLSYISGGFAWTTSEDVNPEDCIFYLDNIRFE